MKLVKLHQELTLYIEDLSFGGEGIARENGLVFFVRGAIPGDEIKAEITKIKSNYCFARIKELIKSSDKRTNPICAHFEYCGGCQVQNLKYEEQIFYKKIQVSEILKRIGKSENLLIEDIIGMKNPYHYRNKMEFSFSPDKEKGIVLGLHYEGRFDKVFDVQYCFLAGDTTNKVLNISREYLKTQKLPAYNLKTHSGFLRHLVVREGKNTNEVMVKIVTASSENENSIKSWGENLISQIPSIKSIYWSINPKLSDVAIGEKEILIWGEEDIKEKIGHLTLSLTPLSFLQPNTQQASKIYETIYQLTKPSLVVLDLYTGGGGIALYLSDKVKYAYGIDNNSQAIISAQKNASLNNIKNVQFIRGEVEKDLEKLINTCKPDLIITDPPRAGMAKKIVNILIKSKVPEIIYVSCNPTTLARDIKELTLKGDYKLDFVQPIDMFPHTYHIEIVAKLSIH